MKRWPAVASAPNECTRLLFQTAAVFREKLLMRPGSFCQAENNCASAVCKTVLCSFYNWVLKAVWLFPCYSATAGSKSKNVQTPRTRGFIFQTSFSTFLPHRFRRWGTAFSTRFSGGKEEYFCNKQTKQKVTTIKSKSAVALRVGSCIMASLLLCAHKPFWFYSH